MDIKDEEREEEEEEEVAVVGQCQRKQYCLGFNHMGKGGPCKIMHRLRRRGGGRRGGGGSRGGGRGGGEVRHGRK